MLAQFRKPVNIYFLLISLLTFLPFSPKEPSLFIGTFILVLAFGVIKEVLEDRKRQKADDELNNSLANVYNYGNLYYEEAPSKNIKVGDIVVITSG